jgi:hypothetical protein
VSATVSTAGPAMPASSSVRLPLLPALRRSCRDST